ncbi:hypothetical protein LCGC14_1332270 [marine sediment metagenome]|uniref:Uncharacterized protein n=1 Tax=marine sediment metagenome TaxID=412755 RepID=A0A0F9KG47_9ZZZZ
MARKRSDIRAAVRDNLRDEFVEGVDLEWEDDELDRLIANTLREMEQKMPYEAKVTAYDALSTVATELSASATNLVVASDDAFPTTFPFYITIDSEVLQVTALASSENFTVGRAKLETTAAIHTVSKGAGLTIVTTANSKEIANLNNIGNLIRVRRNRPVEYRIGRQPKQYRNADRFADILTLDMNINPAGGEAVHLYCLKEHTLTENSSTLRPEHEYILIQGVQARAAINKGREQINALNVGGVNVGPRMNSWGLEQLSIYKQELRSHTLVDNYESLPKD